MCRDSTPDLRTRSRLHQLARDGVEEERAEPDVGRLRYPDALVLGNRADGDFGLDAGVLDDHDG